MQSEPKSPTLPTTSYTPLLASIPRKDMLPLFHLTSGKSGSTPPHQAEVQSVRKIKPVVVGIYGIPGSGKTFILNQLRQRLGDSGHYAFYEGSEMIASLVSGGLAAFQALDDDGKSHWRQQAIEAIKTQCSVTGRTAVVAGHFMFWKEGDKQGQEVYTCNDLNVYTHILYLDIPAERIALLRNNDKERTRSSVSVDHLQRWKETEMTRLRELCYQHGILFSLVSSESSSPLAKITALLDDFQAHQEEMNLCLAKDTLDGVVASYSARPQAVLVMDGDKTLVSEDTGTLFWTTLHSMISGQRDNFDPLKVVFSSKLGYSYHAFRQVVLLYEDAVDDEEYDAICETVAAMVMIHPEFVSLLRMVGKKDHVAAVVVTSGLRLVWDKILAREGLSYTVKVIGGGRIADGFVVTASVKAAIASRLRVLHGMYVVAFGDSSLDLGMLKEAHEAFVVVGEEHTRSKSMENALRNAIDNEGLRASQVLLPPCASPPRLDTNSLPVVQFTDKRFMDSVFRRRQPAVTRINHTTDRSAAKLLMAPMRDARLAGPALRKAHERVGWYLATEVVSDMIGLEEYAIPHVQGTQAVGHRLLHEQQTAIVALMRGGEPMALGVNEAFPFAMLIHANDPFDLKSYHLHKLHTVCLVDSVVNSGKSVVEFIHHIRGLDATIRIVIVAGVVQSQSLSSGSFSDILERDMNIYLVALRLSNNKYTGKGSTDTGNRLFNTTHLA